MESGHLENETRKSVDSVETLEVDKIEKGVVETDKTQTTEEEDDDDDSEYEEVEVEVEVEVPIDEVSVEEVGAEVCDVAKSDPVETVVVEDSQEIVDDEVNAPVENQTTTDIEAEKLPMDLDEDPEVQKQGGPVLETTPDPEEDIGKKMPKKRAARRKRGTKPATAPAEEIADPVSPVKVSDASQSPAGAVLELAEEVTTQLRSTRKSHRRISAGPAIAPPAEAQPLFAPDDEIVLMRPNSRCHSRRTSAEFGAVEETIAEPMTEVIPVAEPSTPSVSAEPIPHSSAMKPIASDPNISRNDVVDGADDDIEVEKPVKRRGRKSRKEEPVEVEQQPMEIEAAIEASVLSAIAPPKKGKRGAKTVAVEPFVEDAPTDSNVEAPAPMLAKKRLGKSVDVEAAAEDIPTESVAEDS
ncbi:hypothetical protein HDU99_007757, partial [Rhizoclosmatium hyalinum]